VTQRRASRTLPETGTTVFAYNDEGLLASETDAKGIRKEFTYDDKARVTAVRYFRVSDGVEIADSRVDTYWDTYNWDASTPSANAKGRVAAVKYKVGAPSATATVLEWYSYTNYGLVGDKRVRYTRGTGTNAPKTELQVTAAYNAYGQASRMTYAAGTASCSTVDLSYTYDAMARLVRLTSKAVPYTMRLGGPVHCEEPAVDVVNNVTYGPGGEMLTYLTETRQYNVLGQVTKITDPGKVSLEYLYSPTANNGQITGMKDLMNGEEVVYQYDSLARLISAGTTGVQWRLAFVYDGWGNRTEQRVTKGSAPQVYLSYDAGTNRITSAGYSFDGAGNMTQMPYGAGTMALSYDPANRLAAAGTEQYWYGPDNRRVYRRTASGQELLSFWWGGRLLMEYQIQFDGTTITRTRTASYEYFGGRRVGEVNDRLSSEMSNGKRYFPYGEERAVTAGSGYKFATYWRESASGLDYADQRWYSSVAGRFLTADPYQASGGVGNPGSWNRYGYVEGDPVNWIDPEGLNRSLCTDVDALPGKCHGVSLQPDAGIIYRWQGGYPGGPGGHPEYGNLPVAVWPDTPDQGGSAIRVTRLVVTSDCWMAKNPKTGAPSRNTTFTAFSGGTELLGSNIKIRETVTHADGSLATDVIGDPNSTGSNGRFNDQKGLSLFQKGPIHLFQSFEVSVNGGAFYHVDVAYSARGPAYGTLGVYFTWDYPTGLLGGKDYNVFVTGAPGDTGKTGIKPCGRE
jgi:RHS repeat-associated protein